MEEGLEAPHLCVSCKCELPVNWTGVKCWFCNSWWKTGVEIILYLPFILAFAAVFGYGLYALHEYSDVAASCAESIFVFYGCGTFLVKMCIPTKFRRNVLHFE